MWKLYPEAQKRRYSRVKPPPTLQDRKTSIFASVINTAPRIHASSDPYFRFRQQAHSKNIFGPVLPDNTMHNVSWLSSDRNETSWKASEAATITEFTQPPYPMGPSLWETQNLYYNILCFLFHF